MMHNNKLSTKICWNCDGSVDKEAVQCLYCGVTLSTTYEDDEDASYSLPGQNTIPFPPYSPQPIDSEEAQPLSSNPKPTVKPAESHIISLPFALLLSGIVLLLFSLILLFFSRDGVLTLKWDAHYWFVYLLISVPLLLLGWTLLKSPEE